MLKSLVGFHKFSNQILRYFKSLLKLPYFCEKRTTCDIPNVATFHKIYFLRPTKEEAICCWLLFMFMLMSALNLTKKNASRMARKSTLILIRHPIEDSQI